MKGTLKLVCSGFTDEDRRPRLAGGFQFLGHSLGTVSIASSSACEVVGSVCHAYSVSESKRDTRRKRREDRSLMFATKLWC